MYNLFLGRLQTEIAILSMLYLSAQTKSVGEWESASSAIPRTAKSTVERFGGTISTGWKNERKMLENAEKFRSRLGTYRVALDMREICLRCFSNSVLNFH